MNDLIGNAMSKVNSALKKVGFPQGLAFLSASIAEDYTKRILEAKYDRLAKTALFQGLKDLKKRQRLVIEFAFYILSAWLKQNLSESSAIKAYIKGITSDFFPEMGKRLINGDTPEGREVIKLAYNNHQTGTYEEAKQSGTEEKSVFKRAAKDAEDGLDFVIETLKKRRAKRQKGGD